MDDDGYRKVFKLVGAARCPECGQNVFIPSLRFPPIDPENPEVWCREFGHWAGSLSECVSENK